jgi:hypothetical protein
MCRICESAQSVTAAADALVIACNTKVSLRQYWGTTLKEPVPERLTELLNKLK